MPFRNQISNRLILDFNLIDIDIFNLINKKRERGGQGNVAPNLLSNSLEDEFYNIS